MVKEARTEEGETNRNKKADQWRIQGGVMSVKTIPLKKQFGLIVIICMLSTL